MTLIKGPNGVIVSVSEELARSLVGAGSQIVDAIPSPEAPKPAPRKRTPRKPAQK